MASLIAAHRGYEYQDLLSAVRLVDVILGTIVEAHVDEKLVSDDRFDDLTTIDAMSHRERAQFKHTENEGQPLTLATFTGDARSLRLDRLLAVAIADREGPGSHAKDSSFRLVLRDTRPVDPRLLAVLRPANPDPGPYLDGMRTLRMRFDPDALSDGSSGTQIHHGSSPNPFVFLRESKTPLVGADLEWFCERLVVEVEAPAASRDLTRPGPAEYLLLNRVRRDIGAELYPNAHRSAVDVAEAIIGTVRAARQGGLAVTAAELLRRAQLRQDFGAVARADPVDRALEVPRTPTVADLAREAASAANDGRPLLVVGPPGQGKSWTCQQMIEELSRRGWLVAEHYCYLGDADGERLPRVLADSVFGSLLGRLAEADPRLVTGQRPRFAADEQMLTDAVERSIADQPGRQVALIIDGIDHVTRVHGGGPSFDPSFTLAEALSSLGLPPGSVLIVLSQPGGHLRPLEDVGAIRVPVPRLSELELRQLAGRLNVIRADDPALRSPTSADSPLLADDEAIADFLAALSERSGGNALYATYLCRETLRHPATAADPSAIVRSLPPFDGSLLNYYQHLHSALGDQGSWVADVLALLGFPVTRSELKEIRPDVAHRVDEALSVLEPVLVERAGQGGVRIYHESYARFLRRPFQDDSTARVALLDHIAAWLKGRGMLEDSRAFRCLLSVLAEANHDREVVGMVGYDFVVRAVAAGFPASAIMRNLATAIGAAGRIGDWPAVVRYVEMSRSAETYQEERFESTMVDFVDVPVALLGPDTIADRLLHDGRPVMAARAGLQMCAAVDDLGAVPPWREYMTAYPLEAEKDKTSYGEASDRQVSLAWLRGRLRLASVTNATIASSENPAGHRISEQLNSAGEPDQPPTDLTLPVNWDSLAGWLDQAKPPANAVIDAIFDTHGVPAVVTLIGKLDQPSDYYLTLAEDVSRGSFPESEGSARFWASKAYGHGLRPGNAHRLIALGIDIDEFNEQTITEGRGALLTLTREVQDRSVQFETGALGKWLDACSVAARRDALGLVSAESLVAGSGWYRCWLRFDIALARAESAASVDQSRLSLDALRLLTEDLNPFSGDPRACDLYRVHGLIRATIRRALALLDDAAWAEGIRILDQVSDSITTTIWGELGGPMTPDTVLRLSVETATSRSRGTVAEALIRDQIEHGAGRKYYSDLAEYRLLGARLALMTNDRAEAHRLWIDACRMLTAYGWHKDITIYELLDPLPYLIAADRARGRRCVAMLQPLCERVPLHTDGRETKGAWANWWNLLAAADPIALARLTAPTLLAHCNDPIPLLHEARSDMWRAWHSRADPIVAGALRLTLEESLDGTDPAALGRLAAVTDGTGADGAAHLMTLLLARADERPFRYSYSNNNELLKRDNELLHQLNSVADRARAPRVTLMPITNPQASPSLLGIKPDANGPSPRPTDYIEEQIRLLFPPGAVGLARAIRSWRSRLYDEDRPDWTTERFSNILGYRIIELAECGREDDAEAALQLIADAGGFIDRSGLLAMLAAGFERNHQARLAAVAYTLAWTRARGRGGLLTFGGETEIVSLRRAAEIDRSLTWSTIAHEIERIVSSGRYGTYGISQALIYGFALGGFGGPTDTAIDVGFMAWNEAFMVIANRAPRVDPSDDPDEPYTAPEPDNGEDLLGDLNVAFATAVVAGLGHAARDQKRRSLVAIRMLLSERRMEVAPAIRAALLSLSDPATLTWLLQTLASAGDVATPVVAACADVLADLARRQHLTVRALARRLLGDWGTPAPPSPEPDPALLGRGPSSLWKPAHIDAGGEDAAKTDELVADGAGLRLSHAEAILPGLGDAVRARVSGAIDEGPFKRRLKAQLDAYSDQVEKRWPDAYLTTEETVEDALQRAAAGGRAAHLANGRPITDPIGWEDILASALLDDPLLPVGLESRRHPRPELAPPPPRGDALWTALRAAAGGQATNGLEVRAAAQRDGMLLGTLTMAPAETAPSLNAGRFGGWRLLATCERRISPRPDRAGDDSVAERSRAVEIRRAGDLHDLNLPPLASGDIRAWIHDLPDRLLMNAPARAQPVIGLDSEVAAVSDALRGLGIHKPMLTPVRWLIVTLGLHPSQSFVLDDNDGGGLALIAWRTEYESSEYHLPWPMLRGSAVAIRNDLFDRLLAMAPGRLVLRDFLAGNVELCG